jgi:glycosyltransferase involved in cell wall biosynthesis
MRITHIIAGSRYGGAEKFFTDLTTSLSHQMVRQHVITRPFPERLNSIPLENLKITPAHLGSRIDLASRLTVYNSVKSFMPDIVMAWMNRGASFVPAGPWVTIGRLGGYYNLKYYSKCEYLICNTPDILNYCIDNGWPQGKAYYIPNFSPENDDKPLIRETLNTPPNASVVAILARLEESKGIDTAIRAMTYIPNVCLWIAGEGSKRTELLKLANSLNLGNRVEFLGWRNDRDALVKSADICLIPSRTEPFGNVILNAWVNSTPAISTTTKGGRFLIKNRINGLLSPIDNPEALSKLISEVITDKKLSTTLINGGLDTIKNGFSEKIVTQRYIDVFNRLANTISRTKK